MEHFNQLTPAEAERLAVLMEEMAETQQVIGKILRHGYDSKHPSGGPINRELLEKELGDVECILNLMYYSGDISKEAVDAHARMATPKKLYYMHHQEVS